MEGKNVSGKLVRGKFNYVLLALFALMLLAMLLPFVGRTLSSGESLNYSGYDMMGSADSVVVEGKDARKVLRDESDSPRHEFPHLYAILMVVAAVGVGMCVLDRKGFSCLLMGLLCGLTALGMTVALMMVIPNVYHLPESFMEGVELPTITDRVQWGLYAAMGLGVLATGWSIYGLLKRERGKTEAIPVNIITRVGVLAAFSAVLYYIPGIPVIPPIYKLDFSTLPVLLGGFSMGVWPGLAILLIKDLTGLLHSSSMGVGEIADFIASASLMIPAVLIYRKHHTFKGAITGLGVGLVVMLAASALANYLIMIPFYVQVMNMPLDAILGQIARTIPAVDSLWKLILLATIPFNLLKGVVLCLITIVLYKRLAPFLKSV